MYIDNWRLRHAAECSSIVATAADTNIRPGGPRTRILADFLIGAHAIATAETFLSRDHGFYSTYFPELQVA